MAKLAVLFLVYLAYHVVYVSSSALWGTGDDEEVRTYIDNNGHIGFIRRSTAEEILLEELRALDDIEERGLGEQDSLEVAQRCKCHCRSRYRNDEWECCKCTWTQKMCFPGYSTVRLEDGTTVKMANLKRGHRVMTVDGNGQIVPSEIRVFMQRNTTGLGLYLTLTTSTGHILTVSRSHLVFTAGLNENHFTFKYAEDIQVGDFVIISQMNSTTKVTITSKGHVGAQGAYTPLTEHGTILVDDVLTSCYASFSHQLAHVAMAPLRWWPSWFEPEPEVEGMRTYVRFWRTLGRWVLPNTVHNEGNYFWKTMSDYTSSLLKNIGLISP